MRKVFLCAVITLAFASLSFAQNAPKASEPPATVEQNILQLTRDWLDAEERRDAKTLQRIIADDFQGTGPMGNAVFKEDVVPAEGGHSGGLSITTSDLKARVFGYTAIVTGHGVPKTGEKRDLRFTVVFARRENAWQMVAGHLSAVPKL